jgi:hypothetical protein
MQVAALHRALLHWPDDSGTALLGLPRARDVTESLGKPPCIAPLEYWCHTAVARLIASTQLLDSNVLIEASCSWVATRTRW